MIYADYLFETSWEVCNKVGGIHTVVSTKAKTLVEKFNNNYILIGPDICKDNGANQEFEQDEYMFKSWREYSKSKGLKFRVGRWKTASEPIVILVDFTQYFSQKDTIFSDFWKDYGLDSLTGAWDYIEPCLFGYAAARVIESYYEFYLEPKDRIVAQFHEWMTGSGILYLKKKVPQIATAFTTHATVLGRCLAGNNMAFYDSLKYFEADAVAKQFNLRAKYSLEKLSALHADVFTTVSEITDRECRQFFGKSADVITPNGFENSIVPKADEYDRLSFLSRRKILSVMRALTSTEIEEDAFLVINSGRYEFHNKGIDLFIRAMGELNKRNISRQIVAVIAVPAHHVDAYQSLLESMNNEHFESPTPNRYLTHHLCDPEHDPILRAIEECGLNNSADEKVKIVFIPSYLDGRDGVVNIPYFDFLTAFDLSVFPSYYEPWGYTPMESLAFGVPTITTSLAGFGRWIEQFSPDHGKAISVIERDDNNTEESIAKIVETIQSHLELDAEARKALKEQAAKLSDSVTWEKLTDNYHKAYEHALSRSESRREQYSSKQAVSNRYTAMPSWGDNPQWKKILIKPHLPQRLSKLQALSQNLWWTWNNDAYELFKSIDEERFLHFQRSPIHLLESLTQKEMETLSNDETFLRKLDAVSAKFDSYMEKAKEKQDGMVAYFSMEFGIHDTLKIFSGGLGMLAGDYLKQASDSNKNMIGIGLLYRNGYFTQQITKEGEQISAQFPQKFSHLPIQAERDENGQWRKVGISLPGRMIYAKIWRCDVGRVPLYLLDTDIESNQEQDRTITSQLYGGNWEDRLKQEILLGIGGIRLIEQMGLPVVLYHNNEGHSAFSSLERMKNYIQKQGYSFAQAKELVRSSTLFTTHTPVPAGHDTFSEELMRAYLGHFADYLNISWEEFMSLGRGTNDTQSKFSMSVLALTFSLQANGVSRIHARVSREMFASLYKGYLPSELHIDHVTNGVHHKTWTSDLWQKFYVETFGAEYLEDESNPEYWQRIYTADTEKIWNIHLQEKRSLIEMVKRRLKDEFTSRAEAPKLYFDTVNKISTEKLTVGFARRFATYKRANLLFTNLERLEQIVKQGVQFFFAGKAHPQDKAGADLIKRIIEVSKMPQFVGSIIFLENYDMYLAKHLVRGVDLWLNTPTRPMEASGTSGEKAVMNGVVNFSVMDGWWAEGYRPNAGWALPEQASYQSDDYQNALDAEMIYNTFEEQIIPCYNHTDARGVHTLWTEQIQNTIAQIAPHYTMKRQLDEYYSKFYEGMFARTELLSKDNAYLARQYASWKHRIKRLWNTMELVELKVPDADKGAINIDEEFNARITLLLGEIKPEEIGIEMVIANKENNRINDYTTVVPMQLVSYGNQRAEYEIRLKAAIAGVQNYAFRIYPKHPLMTHRTDFPLLKWI